MVKNQICDGIVGGVDGCHLPIYGGDGRKRLPVAGGGCNAAGCSRWPAVTVVTTMLNGNDGHPVVI